MSKEYPALLKQFTIRLKRLEKFGFPMIFLSHFFCNLEIRSPRRVQPASSVRIPQNTGRYLLPTINITPLKLSSVSSIRLNGASNCNIFRNSLKIRLSAPVKSPIIRKYKNLDKRRSLYPSISTCNVKSCICCSHLNCKSTIRSTVNGRQFPIVNTTDLD